MTPAPTPTDPSPPPLAELEATLTATAADPAPAELNPLLQILAAIQETNRLLAILTSHAAPARQNPATYQTIAKDRG